jgi:tryptophanyl-tRNA synthetase
MPAPRERVFSGMRPTGPLHVGHLFGALGNWVRLQDDYDCIYCVVDLHALTTAFEDVGDIRQNTREMVADWIAVGVDPERSIVFRQSDVHEHAELFALLGMVTPLSWLERVPTYKGQIAELGEGIDTYGFLGYPLLQTADIVLYRATQVPVGQDQVPHIELAREVVRRMNHLFGHLFPEPQALLAEFPLVLGPDNRKMSKSYGNTINLSDDAETVRKKVMQMFTDPKRVRADVPGTVEGNPVFMYHDAFNPDTAEIEELKGRYRAGKVGDVEVKTKLAKALNAHLEPMRARRAGVLAKPSALKEILVEGSRKARAEAKTTMERVRDAVKLKY